MRVPWLVWTSLASVSCILIGTYWDISWHMTIGRDTFWTPAHLLIQAGGIIAGLSGAYAILLGKMPATVRVWGFRGPLGAFTSVWGAATMVVSAPFDNWWHNAYGLDVRILSPPHIVLTLGILGVALGGVLQIASVVNRTPSRLLDTLLLVAGGEICVLGMIAILEFTFRSSLHRGACYRAIAIVAPLVIMTFSRASRHRWAATLVAGVYTAVMLAGLWVFPLFPAEAKLGPVYQPITHYIPLQFPMLIVVPAFAIDLARTWADAWPRWLRAIGFGLLFVVVLVAVEWPFASFAMSEGARNWVFGGDYQPYFMHPDWYEAVHEFWPDPNLWTGLVEAAIAGVLASYVGMSFGDGIARVKR